MNTFIQRLFIIIGILVLVSLFRGFTNVMPLGPAAVLFVCITFLTWVYFGEHYIFAGMRTFAMLLGLMPLNMLLYQIEILRTPVFAFVLFLMVVITFGFAAMSWHGEDEE